MKLQRYFIEKKEARQINENIEKAYNLNKVTEKLIKRGVDFTTNSAAIQVIASTNKILTEGLKDNTFSCEELDAIGINTVENLTEAKAIIDLLLIKEFDKIKRFPIYFQVFLGPFSLLEGLAIIIILSILFKVLR